MPERFKVVCTMQGAIQVLSFTFTFTFIQTYTVFDDYKSFQLMHCMARATNFTTLIIWYIEVV